MAAMFIYLSAAAILVFCELFWERERLPQLVSGKRADVTFVVQATQAVAVDASATPNESPTRAEAAIHATKC